MSEGAVQITEAKDLYREADFVCSYIRKLVDENECRYGEITIASRQPEDYDIILKLSRCGEVRHVRRFCGSFRVHETSKTTTMDDVCNMETEELRTRNGVTENKICRAMLHKVAKLRVAFRMLREGVVWDRVCK